MNNHILHQSDLDVIVRQAKHQEDYEKTCQVREFARQYRDEPRISFEDGELDISPHAY